MARNGIFPPQTPHPGRSPGSTYSSEGISWHVYILPYIEQQRLWQEVQSAFDSAPSPWSAEHTTVRSVIIASYICNADQRIASLPPESFGSRCGYTSYVGITGHAEDYGSGLFGRRRGASPSDIRDGLSNTLAVGERPPPATLSMGWWYTTHELTNISPSNDGEVPADSGLSLVDPECGGDVTDWPGPRPWPSFAFGPGSISDDCDKYHLWSLHANGANFLFADGSVRFLSYSARTRLRQYATIAGGESSPDL